MLLALDLDGVLCDLGPGLAARLADRFGVVAHPATWRAYDLTHLGVPRDSLRPFLDETFADPCLYEAAPVFPGVPEALAALVEAGWRLVGVTARLPHLAGVTRAWLATHGLPLDAVHHSEVLAKAGVVRALGATAAIEDHAEEAERLGEVCDSWLMHRSYNAAHEPRRCRRLHSWEDAVGRFCQLRLFA